MFKCRKHAKQSREAREKRRDSVNQHEMETGDAGLFSLINSRLGDKPRHSQQHHVTPNNTQTSSLHTSRKASKFAESSRTVADPKPPDRKALIAHQVRPSSIRHLWDNELVRQDIRCVIVCVILTCMTSVGQHSHATRAHDVCMSSHHLQEGMLIPETCSSAFSNFLNVYPLQSPTQNACCRLSESAVS